MNTQQEPALQQTDVIRSLLVVRFASGNQYRYFQDHAFWRGLPSDVDFYPVAETHNGAMIFVGDGYGVQSKHGIAGKYGNGAVYVEIADIPHLVEQCRANFL